VQPTLGQRLRRLVLDTGSQRIDFSRPAARVVLAALALAAVAALAAAFWFAYLDHRAVAVTYTDIRQAYVGRVREKIQVATDAAADERARLGPAGSLRLRVVVSPDGGVASASIVESSGNRAVDDLALRIVRESAPFEPFPERMRRYTTRVEIYSTFQFR
jgi:TonB family protein